MSGALRAVTIVNALIYFGAAAYHSGVVVAAGALAPASIAEALLGLVLVATVARLFSPRVGWIAGVGLALPLLEAMCPALSRAASAGAAAASSASPVSPRRFVQRQLI